MIKKLFISSGVFLSTKTYKTGQRGGRREAFFREVVYVVVLMCSSQDRGIYCRQDGRGCRDLDPEKFVDG